MDEKIMIAASELVETVEKYLKQAVSRSILCLKLADLKKALQEEQPDVDLWKEIHGYFNPHEMELQFDRSKGNTILKPEQLFNFASHFYSLGLDARKEESVGVAESPSKTFPRVNEFDCGSSYRHG